MAIQNLINLKFKLINTSILIFRANVQGNNFIFIMRIESTNTVFMYQNNKNFK